MSETEEFTKQITDVIENRVTRIHNAFRALQDAISATHLTPADFPEAQALGVDVSDSQLAMDYWLRKYLGGEVFEFITGYREAVAARQRNAAASR